MSNTIRTFARYIALPVVSAGILGGAALGLAGAANAGTYSYEPTPRPGIVATPGTIARPPVVVMPGQAVAPRARVRHRHARGRIGE